MPDALALAGILTVMAAGRLYRALQRRAAVVGRRRLFLEAIALYALAAAAVGP